MFFTLIFHFLFATHRSPIGVVVMVELCTRRSFSMSMANMIYMLLMRQLKIIPTRKQCPQFSFRCHVWIVELSEHRNSCQTMKTLICAWCMYTIYWLEEPTWIFIIHIDDQFKLRVIEWRKWLLAVIIIAKIGLTHSMRWVSFIWKSNQEWIGQCWSFAMHLSSTFDKSTLDICWYFRIYIHN